MYRKIIFLVILTISLNLADGKTGKRLCYQCSGENLNCTQQPDKVGSYECFGKDEKCYTWNTGHGLNQRGCTSSKPNCVNSTDCIICDSDLCNVQIFPKDRLQCYHCTNEQCKNINQNQILPCEIYRNSSDNQCYTYTNDMNNITRRGCLTDNLDICNKNLTNCYKCNGKNCNNKNINEIVTTTIRPNRPTIQPTKTTTVSTPLNQTCYRCRSDVNKFCSNSLAGLNHIKPMKCIHEIEDGKNSGCYIETLDDTRVFRGCLIDLDEKDRNKCRDIGHESCSACYQNNCNFGKAPNSSKTITINNIILNLICFIVVLNVLLK